MLWLVSRNSLGKEFHSLGPSTENAEVHSSDGVCLVCSGQSLAAAAVRTLVGDPTGVRGQDSTAVRSRRQSQQVSRRPRTRVQIMVVLST